MKLKSLCLSLLTLTVSGCVTIPNTRSVTVAGTLSAGGIWAESQTDATGDLSLTELIDMLEPQVERTCVPVSGFSICADNQTVGVPTLLPARAGAIIRSAEDEAKIKLALEKACRYLGNKCTKEIRNTIASMR